MAAHLLNAARTLIFSSAPAPSAAAAALAALALLEERPQLVERLRTNAAVLRRELARQGFGAGRADAHIVSVHVGLRRARRPAWPPARTSRASSSRRFGPPAVPARPPSFA